ncbi:hypothetical protein POJ06DRAFT_258262 [Lipomyces tetrasporus]|uniref:TLC domain-containing protein n=1 Tax=Lipomyces tetrasporus TaxID=54092 RepID=A0AAD7VS92_9ASCO|nr:uncharacterized protein POJ06DRAFT_258262 [Lipomyces tetrasporus]KAJ8098890.1 hypothetical protein POJ06DRAFT_258262 [Lipomyces tetrasporus]
MIPSTTIIMSTTTNTPDSTPQAVLAISLALYPLLFYVITPRNATPSLVAKSHEAISAVHSTLVTLLSLFELRRNYDDWAPSRPFSSPAVHDDDIRSGDATNGKGLKIITTRSNLGNCITAIETAYLVQDAVILILGARLRNRHAGEKDRALVKEINWRALVGHHIGLGTALGILQRYIALGREKGILVILMLMLMNASTPIGTTHWYLVNFQPLRRRAILLANFLYLTVYAVFRVYLVYWILDVFGSWTGHSAIEAFRRLPLPCRMGTGTIGAANSIWLIMGVRKFMRRYTSRARASK